MQDQQITTQLSNSRPPDGFCKFCGKTVPPLLVKGLEEMKPRWISLQKGCSSCLKKIATRKAIQKKQEQLRQSFNQAGISTKVRRNSIKNFYPEIQTHTALEAAKSFTLKSDSLLFFGPNGVGKTHLAEAIANRYLDKTTMIFMAVPEFFLELKKFINQSDEVYKLIEHTKKVRLLILDDLGAEKKSEWTQETLFILINHRYLHKLPTIITTNFDLDELSTRIGQRVTSRLIEMCRIIKMDGPDWRQKKRINLI